MESNGGPAEEKEKLMQSSETSLPLPRQQKHNAKTTKILDACKWKDIETLRLLATNEDGLVSDDVRCQACSCHQGNLVGLG